MKLVKEHGKKARCRKMVLAKCWIGGKYSKTLYKAKTRESCFLVVQS